MDPRALILLLAVIPFWGWLTGWSIAAILQRTASWKGRLFFFAVMAVSARMFFWAVQLDGAGDWWLYAANGAALLYGFVNGPH